MSSASMSTPIVVYTLGALVLYTASRVTYAHRLTIIRQCGRIYMTLKTRWCPGPPTFRPDVMVRMGRTSSCVPYVPTTRSGPHVALPPSQPTSLLRRVFPHIRHIRLVYAPPHTVPAYQAVPDHDQPDNDGRPGADEVTPLPTTLTPSQEQSLREGLGEWQWTTTPAVEKTDGIGSTVHDFYYAFRAMFLRYERQRRLGWCCGGCGRGCGQWLSSLLPIGPACDFTHFPTEIRITLDTDLMMLTGDTCVLLQEKGIDGGAGEVVVLRGLAVTPISS